MQAQDVGSTNREVKAKWQTGTAHSSNQLIFFPLINKIKNIYASSSQAETAEYLSSAQSIMK